MLNEIVDYYWVLVLGLEFYHFRVQADRKQIESGLNSLNN